MTEPKDPFEEVTVEFETAVDFVSHIDKTIMSSNMVLNLPETHWIFRGQSSDWKLIPKLFRKHIYNTGRWEEYDTQALLNVCGNLVRGLIYRMDRSLLKLPNNSANFINPSICIRYDMVNFDPSHVYYALAQHTGIPTPLLDFTFDPFVGMFFMCSDDNKKSQKMILWAVNLYPYPLLENNLVLLNHSYSEIPSLRAQKGCFLFNPFQGKDSTNLSFNNEMFKLVESENVYKLTLPSSEKENLMNLLIRRGYNKETMFPNVFDIVENMLRSWFPRLSRSHRLYHKITEGEPDDLWKTISRMD